MKCEICHENPAQTVLESSGNADDELYVCHECAKKERAKRNEAERAGVVLGDNADNADNDSGEGEGPEPPQAVLDLMDALTGIVTGMSRAIKARNVAASDSGKKPEMKPLRIPKSTSTCVLEHRLHLEGLYLIGELEGALRAVRAMGCELHGFDCNGMDNPGHVFEFRYGGGIGPETVDRLVKALVAQETFARQRLCGEMPRILIDATCRALAILKNCRLLSPAEYYDLLSPLRLAASNGIIKGISSDTIDEMMILLQKSADGRDESMRTQREIDQMDADRADEANDLFAKVALNKAGRDLMY